MIDNSYMEKLNKFQSELGLNFNDISLLILAFTHSSYANEHNCENNERLEFLGDAVLQLTSSNFLYRKYPNYREGELSKTRAKNVCEPALAHIAREMGLGKLLLLGNGEIKTGGSDKDSPLADCFESILGAIYLDKGLTETYKVLDKYFFPYVLEDDPDDVNDYKSKLQEFVQADLKKQINYIVTNESGPQHDKLFEVVVYMDGIKLGKGTGKSKKEAERHAAKNALSIMAVNND